MYRICIKGVYLNNKTNKQNAKINTNAKEKIVSKDA